MCKFAVSSDAVAAVCTSRSVHGTYCDHPVGLERLPPNGTLGRMATAQVPPLSRASTIPSRFYLDPEILEAEKERIFGRTWQLVARAEDLPRVGDFVPATILDEPIVITHGLDGELRGLLQRVPPPRRPGRPRQGQPQVASSAATTAGPTAWTAPARGARRWRRPRASAKDDFGLLPGARRPMGPVRLRQPLDDSAPPLADVLGAIPAEVAAAGYDVDHMRLVERRDYVDRVQLEGLRRQLPRGLPPARSRIRSCSRSSTTTRYRVETFRYYSKQHAPDPRAEGGRGAGRRSALHAPATARRTPSTTGSSPTRCSTSTRTTCRPTSSCRWAPDRTLTIFEWFFAEPGTGRGLGVDAAGDRLLATRSSRRTSSSASRSSAACGRAPTTRGRFSAKRENGVYHFQNLVREFLGE